ncbi:uncharacterized protein IL334_004788 [Kwoniella shivajii]|uniref:Uncharacterized protein n=1 Tax=Kwoniella shivajii TaxID=564305 RepID=A0ABZ1D2Q7_9TREE|nr:hypothetical protein IL334_004788 [Kwoniella shivajii]
MNFALEDVNRIPHPATDYLRHSKEPGDDYMVWTERQTKEILSDIKPFDLSTHPTIPDSNGGDPSIPSRESLNSATGNLDPYKLYPKVLEIPESCKDFMVDVAKKRKNAMHRSPAEQLLSTPIGSPFSFNMRPKETILTIRAIKKTHDLTKGKKALPSTFNQINGKMSRLIWHTLPNEIPEPKKVNETDALKLRPTYTSQTINDVRNLHQKRTAARTPFLQLNKCELKEHPTLTKWDQDSREMFEELARQTNKKDFLPYTLPIKAQEAYDSAHQNHQTQVIAEDLQEMEQENCSYMEEDFRPEDVDQYERDTGHTDNSIHYDNRQALDNNDEPTQTELPWQAENSHSGGESEINGYQQSYEEHQHYVNQLPNNYYELPFDPQIGAGQWYDSAEDAFRAYSNAPAFHERHPTEEEHAFVQYPVNESLHEKLDLDEWDRLRSPTDTPTGEIVDEWEPFDESRDWQRSPEAIPVQPPIDFWRPEDEEVSYQFRPLDNDDPNPRSFGTSYGPTIAAVTVNDAYGVPESQSHHYTPKRQYTPEPSTNLPFKRVRQSLKDDTIGLSLEDVLKNRLSDDFMNLQSAVSSSLKCPNPFTLDGFLDLKQKPDLIKASKSDPVLRKQIIPLPEVKKDWTADPAIRNPEWYSTANDRSQSRQQNPLPILVAMPVLQNIPLVRTLRREGFELIERIERMNSTDIIISPSTSLILQELAFISGHRSFLATALTDASKHFDRVIVVFETISFSASERSLDAKLNVDPLNREVKQGLDGLKRDIHTIFKNWNGPRGKVELVFAYDGAEYLVRALQSLLDEEGKGVRKKDKKAYKDIFGPRYWFHIEPLETDLQTLNTHFGLNTFRAWYALSKYGNLNRLVTEIDDEERREAFENVFGQVVTAGFNEAIAEKVGLTGN